MDKHYKILEIYIILYLSIQYFTYFTDFLQKSKIPLNYQEGEKEEDKEDKKSVTSEKKDLPEKEAEATGGDGDKDPELGGKAPQAKCKNNKCHVFHQRFKVSLLVKQL